jgi:hypothetical protein
MASKHNMEDKEARYSNSRITAKTRGIPHITITIESLLIQRRYPGMHLDKQGCCWLWINFFGCLRLFGNYIELRLPIAGFPTPFYSLPGSFG